MNKPDRSLSSRDTSNVGWPLHSSFPALVLLVLLTLFVAGTGSAPAKPAPGAKVENFRLLDHEGRSHELYRQKHLRAVVLFVGGNGCPIVRQTLPALREVQGQFATNGVAFWCLNSNPQDDLASIQKESAEFQNPFPVLMDRGQWIASSLGIDRTAEVLVVETKGWTLVYRGAVDDRLAYATQKEKADRHFLKDALTDLFAGRTIATATSEFKGCRITLENALQAEAAKTVSPVSYVHKVAPILQRHCVTCHSPGNIGPFAMTNYAKVKGWSSMIREVLLEQRMPPWPADPHVGSFANDRSLATQDATTLLQWIAQGCPRDEGEDPLTQNIPPPATGWTLGKPDAIVSMKMPFNVPATGVVPYQYFIMDAPIEQDQWLKGAVLKAGNPKVLHHALIFVKYPEHLKSIEPRQDGGTAGYFTGFVPGTEPVFFPESTGKFLPKGSTIIFQMHYSPTGKPEQDLTQLGLYFLPEKPKWELRTRAVTQKDLAIPPGARDHAVKASMKFKRSATLYNLSPHMHIRGSRFKYTLAHEDGRREDLLSVPRWDFNWQTLYRLSKPIEIPAGAELICEGSFDNSTENPGNPDPKAWVTFGEQTTDEMFIGYFDIAVPPLEPKAATPRKKAGSAE